MNSKIYSYICLTVAGILAISSSCKQIKKTFDETINSKPQKQEKKDNAVSDTQHNSASSVVTTHTTSIEKPVFKSIFERAEKLDSIQNELKNLPRFKGKKLMIYESLYFYDYQGGQIHINIQNPDSTENVDAYLYANGKWQEPVPVRITGNIKQVNFLFPLDKVKFSTAKKVYDTTIEKMKEMNVQTGTQFVYFDYMKPTGTKEWVKWYTTVNGQRNTYNLDFTVDGQLKQMKER